MVYLPPAQPVPAPYTPDDYFVTENELAGLIGLLRDNQWYLAGVLSRNISDAENRIKALERADYSSLLTNIQIINSAIQNRIAAAETKLFNAVKSNASLILQNIIFSEDNIKQAVADEGFTTRNAIAGWSNKVIDTVRETSANVFNLVVASHTALLDAIHGIVSGVDPTVLNEVKAVRSDLAAMENRLGIGMIVQTGVISSAISLESLTQKAAMVAQTATLTVAMTAETAVIEGSIAAQTATILAAIGASEVFDTAKIPLIIGAILTAIVALIGSGIPDLQEIANKLFTNQYDTYQNFLSDFNNVGGTGGITKFLLDVVRLPAVLVGGIISTAKPYISNLERLALTDAMANWPTDDQFLRAFHRLRFNEDYIKNRMRGLGLRPDDIDMLVGSSYTTLPADLLRAAKLRDFISQDENDDQLKRLGFSDYSVDILNKLYEILPSLQDIISIAVREGFTPEIAEKFGQYEEFPEKFGFYAGQQGLSPDFAKAMWAAHWRLPSTEQGFEMFQRNKINYEQLQLLMRANDVMPFWRDKLLQIAYSPLRLVDIRNFHKQGVLHDDELVREYMNRGYSPENAQRAALYTITVNKKGTEIEEAEIRQLTRATIQQAFKLGLMTRDDAKSKLIGMNYSNEDAELFLDIVELQDSMKKDENKLDDNFKRIAKLATDGYSERVINRLEAEMMLKKVGYTPKEIDLELDTTDYEFAKRFKAHVVDWYKELYITWTIDLDTFTTSLAEFGFEQGEIDKLIEEFDVLRETRVKKPSYEQVIRWFRKNIIGLEALVNELKGLGYRDNYISYILIDIGAEETTQ